MSYYLILGLPADLLLKTLRQELREELVGVSLSMKARHRAIRRCPRGEMAWHDECSSVFTTIWTIGGPSRSWNPTSSRGQIGAASRPPGIRRRKGQGSGSSQANDCPASCQQYGYRGPHRQPDLRATSGQVWDRGIRQARQRPVGDSHTSPEGSNGPDRSTVVRLPPAPDGIEFPVYDWDGDAARFAREIEAAGQCAEACAMSRR